MILREAESPVAERVQASPNHGERRDGRRPDMIVLHYTGMPTAALALERLCDPAAEVSAHYLVFEDGRVWQLVAEGRRAWHAGAEPWAGERDLNSRSIGIEIVNAGHEGGLPPYPAAQIEATIRLCLDIRRRWPIPPERILGHSDIAPARKEDPGERFPWAELARHGLGVWVEPAPLVEGIVLGPGDEGAEVEALQAGLARIGYELGASGVYDATTRSVVTAFQRRFRPGRVDGLGDPSTLKTLEALSAALAEASSSPDDPTGP